jgi:hypothetical protein
MATTQPIMLQPRIAPAAFWEEFRRGVEHCVRECNAIADERLWVISATRAPLRRLTVESATRSGDRIECSFDVERGILTCLPGPAVHGESLQFQWNDGKLLRDGREYAVEEALRLVLDELVCVDAE